MKYITFLSAKCVSVSLAILGLLLSAIACDDKEYGDAMSEGQLMNDIEMNIESSIALGYLQICSGECYLSGVVLEIIR